MTEPAEADLLAQPAPYFQVWVESLAQVLGQIAGSPVPCTVFSEAPAELPPPSEGDLWIVGACSGGLRGEMSLRLPAAATVRLAEIFVSAPPSADSAATPEVPVEVTPDHREAAVELLRQVGGLVASALTAAWGEVQLRLEHSAGAPSWPPSSSGWLRAGEAAPTVALLEMHLSAALGAALRAERTEAAKPAAILSPSVPSSLVAASPEQSKVKLDLLLDVELALTLRFGSRRLLLREVLDLIPGAVVDLDRQVDEPVDVLLDGRLVARGEVVVMDGNYGVRVTEVAPASPQHLDNRT
jgi:flagellar motor switch protein FliN